MHTADAFNHANDTDVDELTDTDLPCAGANPTVDEINTGFRKLILRIVNSVDAPAVEVPTGILTATGNAIRYHVNDVIRWINNTIVTKRHFIVRYNTGFAERKNRILLDATERLNNILLTTNGTSDYSSTPRSRGETVITGGGPPSPFFPSPPSPYK